MRFNTEETELLLTILKPLLHLDHVIILVEILTKNEYVRGRNLNILYDKLSKSSIIFNDERDEKLKLILKRIKFKATPR